MQPKTPYTEDMECFPVTPYAVGKYADEEFVSINELAKELADILDFKLDPIYVKDRPKEVKEAICSSDKARKLLGYKTKTSLKKGLKEMIKDIKEKGPKEFEYNYKIEINNENTPDTWKKKKF